VDVSYLFWDLDGTLTDPGIGITNSVMYALKKFNIEVADRSVLYPFIGPPLLESFKKYYGFDEETAHLGVTYYREYFGEKGIFENEVYPGIPELLDKCAKNGFKHVLATSKPEHYAVQIMEHFDLAKYFHCQFIIATHSPFILSLEGALIYDLDSDPIDSKKWYELENVKTYYNFFKEHTEDFEDTKPRERVKIQY